MKQYTSLATDRVSNYDINPFTKIINTVYELRIVVTWQDQSLVSTS